MNVKLAILFYIMLVSTEQKNNKLLLQLQQQKARQEYYAKCREFDIFPDESSVKLFRNKQTNGVFWKDSNEFESEKEVERQKIVVNLEFLQGKWFNSDDQQIHVKGKKCIFSEFGKRFEIIEEERNFVINGYRCSKNQSGSGGILWTHDFEPNVRWMRTRIEKKYKNHSQTANFGLFVCFSNWIFIPSLRSNSYVKEKIHTNVDEDNAPPQFAAENAMFKLIQRGALRGEAVDGYGKTALHWAAWNGIESSCKTLLRNGAQVNAKDVNGQTPLMMAVAGRGHIKVVKILLHSGANVKIADDFGRTALELATNCCANTIRAHGTKKHSSCIIL